MMLVIITCKVIHTKIAIAIVAYRTAAFILRKHIIHTIITKDIAMKKNILFLILILSCSSIVADDAAKETEQNTEKIAANAQKIPVVVIAADDQDDNEDDDYGESVACPTCGAHTCPTCGAATRHAYHQPYYCDDFECGYPHTSHYPFGW